MWWKKKQRTRKKKIRNKKRTNNKLNPYMAPDGRRALLPLRQWIWAVPDSHNALALALGEGSGGAGLSSFWVKKKKITEGRKAGE